MIAVRFLLATILVIASNAFPTNSYWPGKTLSPSEVSEKWGKQALDVDKFREGDAKVRAAMTFDLLSQQSKYVGKSIPEIKKIFGTHDGHYFNDWIPAYIIQEGHKRSEETWQIVFLPDKDKKVSKIIVHKNCCE